MKYLLLFLATSIAVTSYCQNEENLLKGIADSTPKREKVYNAFKSSRVIMSQSMEMLRPGVLDFRILHRFGNVNQGLSQFFGLDQASIRLGLDYGISNDLSVGIGRSSFRKEVDGFAKWRVIQQSTGPGSFPVSLIAVGGITIIGAPWTGPADKNNLTSRTAYYTQAIIGRKFSERLTLQVSPIFLHQNYVATAADPNEVFGAGIGGRLKLSKRVSLNVDYYYVANKNDSRDLHNPLSIGFDIETGGHVFQLHFTNAVGMNERAFLTETTNSWGRGDIQFGFNISRAFQIAKKK